MIPAPVNCDQRFRHCAKLRSKRQPENEVVVFRDAQTFVESANLVDEATQDEETLNVKAEAAKSICYRFIDWPVRKGSISQSLRRYKMTAAPDTIV